MKCVWVRGTFVKVSFTDMPLFQPGPEFRLLGLSTPDQSFCFARFIPASAKIVSSISIFRCSHFISEQKSQRKIWEYGSLRFRETYSEPVNYFCNSLHLRCLAEFWIWFWFLLHISKSSLLVNVQASSNNFFSEQFFKNTYSIGIYSQLLLTSFSAGQALKLTFDF